MAAFLLSILILTALLYWQGLHGPFLLDDLQNLSGAKIKDPFWQEWFRVSFANNSGPFGRPLSVASLALNEYWLGSGSFGYKLINLCLHLTIGLLIYNLVNRLLLNLDSNNKAGLIALVTTLIWLIHPLQVSTVLYAVQRMAQMNAFFLVLGMLFYVHGRFKLSLLCWPLAILSKETGVLLPFYLLAIEYFINCNKNSNPNSKKLPYLFLLTTLTTLSGLIYYLFHYKLYQDAFINKGYTLTQQIFTQIEILCFYINLIFLPKLSNMSLFHDDFAIVTQANWSLFFSITCFISLITIIYFARKKHPVIAFGLSFFFISHFIESTVLPLELVFEHRNYLAILGLILIPSYYIVRYISKIFNLFIILGPLLIILIFMTFVRVQSWANAELFLKLELLEHPKSPRAQVEWANFLLENNQFAQADIHLNLAHTLAPHNAGINLHRVLIQSEQNYSDKKLIQQALNDVTHQTITPYAILVLDNLVKKSFNNPYSSITSMEILTLLNAGISNTKVQSQKNYLATLYHLRAGIYVLHHNMPHAIQDLDMAYQLYPKRLGPLIEKVKLQIALKEKAAAQNTLKKVIKLAKTQWVENREVLTQLNDDIKAISQ